MQWFSGSFSSIQRDCSSPSPFWYEKFSLVFIFWKYLLLQPLFIVLGFLLASTLCSSVIRTDSRTCNFWHFSRSYIIRSNNWNGYNHCWAKWWPIPCFSNHRWWAGIPWSIPFFTNISVQIIALLWMRKKLKRISLLLRQCLNYHCPGHTKCRYRIWSVKYPGANDSWCYCTSQVMK